MPWSCASSRGTISRVYSRMTASTRRAVRSATTSGSRPGPSTLIAWINLHSKFGFFLQRALLELESGGASRSAQGPKNWWTDPEVAARAENATALRRSRSLFRGDRRGMPAARDQALHPRRRTGRQLSLEGRPESARSDPVDVADRCPGDRCGDQGPRGAIGPSWYSPSTATSTNPATPMSPRKRRPPPGGPGPATACGSSARDSSRRLELGIANEPMSTPACSDSA